MFNLTPVVLNLLIINVLVYILELGLISSNEAYVTYFQLAKSDWFGIQEALYGPVRGQQIEALKSIGIEFQPYQLVTHFFAHSPSSFFHILMNMFALAMLGPQVERVVGSKRFLTAYLVSGTLGGIFIAFIDPSINPVLGASGAVSGVMLLFAMIYPDARMILFPIPIPIKAKWLVTGFIVVSLYFVVDNMRNPAAGGNVSHFGHLAGMAAIFLYLVGVRTWYQLRR